MTSREHSPLLRQSHVNVNLVLATGKEWEEAEPLCTNGSHNVPSIHHLHVVSFGNRQAFSTKITRNTETAMLSFRHPLLDIARILRVLGGSIHPKVMQIIYF